MPKDIFRGVLGRPSTLREVFFFAVFIEVKPGIGINSLIFSPNLIAKVREITF